MKLNTVSRATVGRLPHYLSYLRSLPKDADSNISATAIAKALGYGEVQVRKDLSAASGAGRPKTGYIVSELIDKLETYLGQKNKRTAVIIGAGKLGKALLEYDGFSEYGLEIPAAFDNDAEKVGVTDSGKQIFMLNKLDMYCKEVDVKIGIIAVPAKSAQSICDLLVKNNISAIWNFAPTKVVAPKRVIVENENLALSLAVLSMNLNCREAS